MLELVLTSKILRSPKIGGVLSLFSPMVNPRLFITQKHCWSYFALTQYGQVMSWF